MKKENANKTRIEKFSTLLKCELTKQELLDCGAEMADKQEENNRLEESLAAVKKEYQSKIDGATARINELAGKLRAKAEHRMVVCERICDYTTGTVCEKRTDTGETFQKREMTEEERQMSLPMTEETKE